MLWGSFHSMDNITISILSTAFILSKLGILFVTFEEPEFRTILQSHIAAIWNFSHISLRLSSNGSHGRFTRLWNAGNLPELPL